LIQNDESEKYDVEKIINHALSGNKHKTLKLLIKWENYTKPTWEPANKFEDTKAYDEYLAHNDITKPFVKIRRGQKRKKKPTAEHLKKEEGNYHRL
jgi:hypothetical protein